MLKIVIDITALGYRLLWHGVVPRFRQQRCNRIHQNQYHSGTIKVASLKNQNGNTPESCTNKRLSY